MEQSASLGVLLDHAQDKIVLLDEQGRFEYANDAVRRILGHEPADLVGENAFEYIHPDDVDEVIEVFERTITQDSFDQNTTQYRFRTADGSWVWLESRMSNLTDSVLDGYVVSSRDVSDRVAAERDRQVAATRLEELAAATGDVLWMFDGDWSELLFMNPAYESVYGGDLDDLEADASAFLDTVHPDDVPAVEAAMRALSAGESVDMEYRVNPAEDYGLWVWVQAEPIVVDGEVVRITGFTRDVTDRRRRERQLFVMDNLLRHNLRNDMTLILGNAQLIEQETPAAADRTAVIRQTGEGLLASAEKEREIIDLLTSEAGSERLDVGDTLHVAAEVVRDRFPEATVEVAAPADLAVAAVDELRLALVELLENAVRHADPHDATVRVEVATAGDRVALTVVDEAPPIPDIEARVLSGDYEMNDVYHSSGLGLWLIYWVVELSDGDIAVTRGEGGNEVRISLPAAE